MILIYKTDLEEKDYVGYWITAINDTNLVTMTRYSHIVECGANLIEFAVKVLVGDRISSRNRLLPENVNLFENSAFYEENFILTKKFDSILNSGIFKYSSVVGGVDDYNFRFFVLDDPEIEEFKYGYRMFQYTDIAPSLSIHSNETTISKKIVSMFMNPKLENDQRNLTTFIMDLAEYMVNHYYMDMYNFKLIDLSYDTFYIDGIDIIPDAMFIFDYYRTLFGIIIKSNAITCIDQVPMLYLPYTVNPKCNYKNAAGWMQNGVDEKLFRFARNSVMNNVFDNEFAVEIIHDIAKCIKDAGPNYRKYKYIN